MKEDTNQKKNVLKKKSLIDRLGGFYFYIDYFFWGIIGLCLLFTINFFGCGALNLTDRSFFDLL